MLDTTMPRARQASRSTLLVPVAETAIIFSSGSAAMAAASSGTLLVIATAAPRRRSTTCPGSVAGYSTHSWAKAGRRTAAISDSASSWTMRTASGRLQFEGLAGGLGDGADLRPERGVAAINQAFNGAGAQALDRRDVALQQVDHTGRPFLAAGQFAQRKHGRGSLRAGLDDQRCTGQQGWRHAIRKAGQRALRIEHQADHAGLADGRAAQGGNGLTDFGCRPFCIEAAILRQQ